MCEVKVTCTSSGSGVEISVGVYEDNHATSAERKDADDVRDAIESYLLNRMNCTKMRCSEV